MRFRLPEEIAQLVVARDRLRKRFGRQDLRFTFDGNLVGDIGEAIAADLFGLDLSRRNSEGVDGVAPDGTTVQIKATSTGRGPAFRYVATRADRLLFLDFDFQTLTGEVVFNGPEKTALQDLPDRWNNQRVVSRTHIVRANAGVRDEDRLKPVPDSGIETL